MATYERLAVGTLALVDKTNGTTSPEIIATDKASSADIHAENPDCPVGSLALSTAGGAPWRKSAASTWVALDDVD